MSRKKARENTFSLVYQIEFNKLNEKEKLLEYYYNENNNSEEEKEYIKLVYEGILEKLEEIDNKILNNLKNWKLSRLSKVDLAILRLAIYEILYIDDLSDKISANEAVELAKMYGDDNSPKFVNGVIAKIIEEK